MSHHHHITVEDEQYIFRPETKKKLLILLGVGVVLFILGLILAMNGGGHHGPEQEGKISTEVSNHLVASLQHGEISEGQAAGATHEGGSEWLSRLKATLWMNNIYFVGLGLIGLFFVAVQYAAEAGWSAGILRIPISMGSWLPIAGVVTLVLFFWFLSTQTVFHWVDSELYDKGSPHFDELLNGKSGFFYWPLAAGTFPLFYVARMVIFFSLWYYFLTQIKKNMLAEDLNNSTSYWFRNKYLSAWFLVVFGISSAVSAWDWIMTLDPHWFSTMFGWYTFASWWVTGLAAITLIVAHLKSAGYLKIVNANHLHDLGKFVFAFSIFWTYVWFGQFLLIYYANIPEETVYFVERLKTSPYSWIFYANLILNFVLPFLLFMTRDAKRQLSMLKLVCPIVLVGHWFDFYNMVTPAIAKEHGGVGFMEIGTALIFAAAYLWVVLNSLSKVPLIGKNHPMLEESLHHNI